MASTQLQSAYQLLKTGDKAQAARRLRTLVKQDSDNAQAWWLLAHALSDPAEIREALTRNLALRPDHAAGKKALAAHDRKYPPPASSDEDDEFERLFAMVVKDLPQAAPRQANAAPPSKPKKNNQAWLLYGSVALVILFVCGGIAVVLREATSFVGQVADVVNTMDVALTDYADYEEVPGDVSVQGTIAVGERKTRNVDTWIDDLWTFAGQPGQQITIRVNARDSMLDPMVFLYRQDGRLLAENDDRIFGEDYNSELRVTLPEDGRYTIIVSAFGAGGAYELLLN